MRVGLSKLRASTADLSPVVASALAAPNPGRRTTVPAAGHAFSRVRWGRPGEPPVLLVHGISSSAATWWRVGPAIAAAGYQVTAVDLPGHGRTEATGGHRFTDTAAVLAAFIRADVGDPAGLAVVGHSWGGMVVAALPSVGLRPRLLVLIDPPTSDLPTLEVYARDPTEQGYGDINAAMATVRRLNPTWADRDVLAKAEALHELDGGFVLRVLLGNGDWDAGLGSLGDAAAVGIPVWYLVGSAQHGSVIDPVWLPRLEARVGVRHVLQIADASHAPQRSHPEATTLAIIGILDGLAGGT
jgi:pimeloyl-ACP methyl ester carboxylesterase